MLVYEKDYVIIDAEKSPIWQGLTPRDIGAGPDAWELRISFSIQCNGKLRRTSFVLDIEDQRNTNGSTTDAVNGYRIADYKVAYAVFEILRGMGYDIDDVNAILRDSMRVFEN